MAYTTINKPSSYFNTKLYTGNGSTQSITGVGFQPDFTWIKSRNDGGWHNLFDAVRGAPKRIFSNSINAQDTTTLTTLTSFDSDGFSLGNNTDVNVNGLNIVSWNWKANGAGSSNTDGSITSTVSANTTSGFSIVKYTGTGVNATVGHGLGVAPKFVVVKRLDTTGNWVCWHTGLTSGAYYISLNTTDAQNSNASVWNSTIPTSSVFSLGTNTDLNGSGGTYVAYCFAEKKGFSKFGTYVGNSPTSQAEHNGAFVYTGFKPAFVILKQAIVGTVAGQSWYLHDNKRTPYNPSSLYLKPDVTDIEASAPPLIDLLSNGFKINSGYSAYNDNGSTYIYMAFAEHPLVSSTGTPCTAR